MVDLGTGTGRMLEVFSDRILRGSGIDNNSQMLKVARSNLAAREHIAVRQGDLHAAPLESGIADLVSLHQVLHYLEDPEEAIIEASRLLSPDGKLLIVDYEDHDRDDFRTDYAHRRLGFTDDDIRGWLSSAGLRLKRVETIETRDNRPDVRMWIGATPVLNRKEA
jgi:ArsR family transcriptional regulator